MLPENDIQCHAEHQIDQNSSEASLAFGRDNKTVRQHVAEVRQSLYERSQGCAVTAISSIRSAAHATMMTLHSGWGRVSSHAP